jgi:hypothetical protein
MALGHTTKVFAIKECRIARLLTDPFGAPPATYAASVALPGVKKLAPLAGTINNKMLHGDNRILDADGVLDSLKTAIDHAKLSLDALAVMFSTAVVDSGVTPNMLATWQFAATDTLQFFKLEARAVSADQPASGAQSDVLISLWKCKLDSFPSLGLMEEDFQVFNQGLILVPRQADAFMFQIVPRETGVPLT